MPGIINNLTEEEQNSYLDNKYGVKKINLYEDIQHKCPLGEQVGVTHYEIEVIPGEKLAELIALHWKIQDLMGKVFTLESGANEVLEMVKNAYQDAHYIQVKASCKTNRHMACDVIVDYVRK